MSHIFPPLGKINIYMFANLSRQISLYLAGNWSERFDETLEALRAAVLRINSTRVDLSLTEGLSSWISSAFSYFKEWVGVVLFAAAITATLLSDLSQLFSLLGSCIQKVAFKCQTTLSKFLLIFLLEQTPEYRPRRTPSRGKSSRCFR